jgi:ketosteroid isomerase-like protein
VSEANVELARRAFEAFAVRDLDALRGLMDEEVEFLPVTANLTTGGIPYRGRDGIAAYFADVDRVWEDLRIYPDRFRDSGDSVVVLGRIHARGGGMVIDRPTGWVWRMRDGKILSGRVYASHEEALRDVGLESG